MNQAEELNKAVKQLASIAKESMEKHLAKHGASNEHLNEALKKWREQKEQGLNQLQGIFPR